MKKYYVYEWRDPRPEKNNEVWYVGKGCCKRAFEVESRSKPFIDKYQSLVSKGYLPEPTIVYYTDDEDDAFLKERLLVQQYGRKWLGEGTLMNIQAGGIGGDSESSRKTQLKLAEEGRHNFTSELTTKNAKRRIDNGTHHFLDSEWQKEMNQRAYASGNHPFLGGKLQAETNKRRVDDKTHNFLGPEANKARVEAGTHNFLNSENNVHAKLTKAQAYEIKYNRTTETNEELGKEFGVQGQSIGKLRRGNTWKNL